MIRLLIKGSQSDAQKALNAAGIEPLTELKVLSTDFSQPLTLTHVSDDYEVKVRNWYLKDYPPYPLGSLMLYTRTDLAELGVV